MGLAVLTVHNYYKYGSLKVLMEISIDYLIKRLPFRKENLKSSKDTPVCYPRSAIYKIEALALIPKSSKDGHIKMQKLILQALIK